MRLFDRRRDDDPKDLLTRGSRALERRRLDEAIPLLEEARRLDPESIPARLNLGAAYHLSGRHSDAIGHFEAALAAEPENVTAMVNLAAAENALGHLDRAVELLEQAARTAPAHPDVHFNLAVAYARQGRLQAAATELRSELAQHPGSRRAADFLAEVNSRVSQADA